MQMDALKWRNYSLFLGTIINNLCPFLMIYYAFASFLTKQKSSAVDGTPKNYASDDGQWSVKFFKLPFLPLFYTIMCVKELKMHEVGINFPPSIIFNIHFLSLSLSRHHSNKISSSSGHQIFFYASIKGKKWFQLINHCYKRSSKRDKQKLFAWH